MLLIVDLGRPERLHPDGSHVQPVLGLSSFAPRFIDWGPRVADREDDDNADR